VISPRDANTDQWLTSQLHHREARYLSEETSHCTSATRARGSCLSRPESEPSHITILASITQNNTIGKNLLESVLLVLERAAYKSGLPLRLPPYENLGSDALFACDICLYVTPRTYLSTCRLGKPQRRAIAQRYAISWNYSYRNNFLRILKKPKFAQALVYLRALLEIHLLVYVVAQELIY
jgi:hypothetical protein